MLRNSAARFSTKAASPSRASSDANSFACSSRSSANPDSSGSCDPYCTARLMCPAASAARPGVQNPRA